RRCRGRPWAGSPEIGWANYSRVSAIAAQGQRPASVAPRGPLCSHLRMTGLEPRVLQRLTLALCHHVHREVLDRLVKKAVEIQLGVEMQEHGAEADRGAVHEHEFARHRDGAEALESLMDAERLLASVIRRLDPVSNRAHAVVEQRAVNEASPDIERLDQFAIEPPEAP